MVKWCREVLRGVLLWGSGVRTCREHFWGSAVERSVVKECYREVLW